MAQKPTTSRTQSNPPSHEQIAERARALWQERGSPAGRDLEHWLEAERLLRDEQPSGAKSPPPSSRPSTQRQDLIESEKRLDGLIQNKPSPASRTPKGERL